MAQGVKNNKNVGVVIPVFNTPLKMLDECVKSVLAQSYKDFEILLVNDGSDEKYLKILQRYVKLDSRITLCDVAHNQGLSVARNIGIDYFAKNWGGGGKLPKKPKSALGESLALAHCQTLTKSPHFTKLARF